MTTPATPISSRPARSNACSRSTTSRSSPAASRAQALSTGRTWPRTLDPRRIDQRVWDALRELFATNVRAIVRPVTTTGGDSAMAYYRRGGEPRQTVSLGPRSSTSGPEEVLDAVPRDPSPGDRDELDRLFLGET